jgi:hypothetical protein
MHFFLAGGSDMVSVLVGGCLEKSGNGEQSPSRFGGEKGIYRGNSVKPRECVRATSLVPRLKSRGVTFRGSKRSTDGADMAGRENGARARTVHMLKTNFMRPCGQTSRLWAFLLLKHFTITYEVQGV